MHWQLMLHWRLRRHPPVCTASLMSCPISLKYCSRSSSAPCSAGRQQRGRRAGWGGDPGKPAEHSLLGQQNVCLASSQSRSPPPPSSLSVAWDRSGTAAAPSSVAAAATASSCVKGRSPRCRADLRAGSTAAGRAGRRSRGRGGPRLRAVGCAACCSAAAAAARPPAASCTPSCRSICSFRRMRSSRCGVGNEEAGRDKPRCGLQQQVQAMAQLVSGTLRHTDGKCCCLQ